MKKKLAAACLLSSLATAAAATDILVEAGKPAAYAMDQRGVVARSGTGLCWRTGYWTPAQAIAACDPDYAPKAEAKPAPLAAAPAAPPPAVPAPAPAPQKCDFSVTLSADETFAFDSARLTGAAIDRIDREVAPMLGRCATVQRILVTGHTDRLGSDAYNQKLSERRADSVRTYLAEHGAAGGMEAVGAGEAQPLPDVRCADALGRKALIACLAPNRRVTIDVEGTAK